jgi:molybdenum cofactor cytidylyltransferase
MRPRVSGLVLAAGTSTRLGHPKQLLPFRGTTLLGWVLAQATASRALDEVIVIIGSSAEAVRQHVAVPGVRVVENPDFGEGCSASYRAGLGALASGTDAVAVLPGDMVGLESAVIDAVVEGWRQGGEPIVAADYRGRLGHPLVFAHTLFGELAALHGDKAAWKLLDGHAARVGAVAVDRPYPMDVNTPEDYATLRRVH